MRGGITKCAKVADAIIFAMAFNPSTSGTLDINAHFINFLDWRPFQKILR